MSPSKKICVFCGSSFGSKPEFSTEAAKLGLKFSQKDWGIVYGGGTTGLMGVVANSCASNGGFVHGIIPEALISRERTDDAAGINEKLKESVENHVGTTPIPDEDSYGTTTIVKDMHTRKKMMSEEAEAFVALPGGYGTFEELLEMTTWSQLGIHGKAIVLFNVNGFFDKFVEFIQESIDAGFISKANGEIIKTCNTVDEVVEAIENYVVPQGRFKLNWSDKTDLVKP
ncbi:unnamed protein product [Kuraishia capsulata CBS 1993]|uniref:Cytokinin riboside 5'-monophosphate phosphoribohydrolase n=1 Tax=Kuraishia capsulata CBS 1993 TaxID=1382522 RepID=W6MNT3_9ASCO|nr:uncharacterized protein KUCA_T00003918001 [Kuraishia capsulata CBS 1993]CDK27938.1 unnamed protein product [Kuraishia capsulata CBS 1993]